MDKSQDIMLNKRSQAKEYILYNSTYVKYIFYDFIYMKNRQNQMLEQ